MSIETVASTAMNVGLMILTLLLFGGVSVGGVILYLKWKKYSMYNCIIFRRDGFGQLTQYTDRAGVFVDSKTKNKRFFLKKSGVGLDPDNVPFIPAHTKTVYLLQTGEKNFHFINMKIDGTKINLHVGEEDVNWAINSYERQKKMFQQSMWMQALPFVIMAFVCIVILIIFIYFFKEFDTLKDVAVAFKDAAQLLSQANSGTTVLQG